MKILDLKDKLPIKVKLNSNFKLEDSFDVNTKLLIKSFELEEEYDDGNCYKVHVSALKEDYDYNMSVAVYDWYDDHRVPSLCYFDVNKPNGIGNYDDTIYVMEDEDCFDIVEDNLFPNGIDSYLKIYYEISTEIDESMKRGFFSKKVTTVSQTKGREGLYALAKDLAHKFEHQYSPIWFEIYDYYKTVDEFLKEELYEL